MGERFDGTQSFNNIQLRDMAENRGNRIGFVNNKNYYAEYQAKVKDIIEPQLKANNRKEGDV